MAENDNAQVDEATRKKITDALIGEKDNPKSVDIKGWAQEHAGYFNNWNDRNEITKAGTKYGAAQQDFADAVKNLKGDGVSEAQIAQVIVQDKKLDGLFFPEKVDVYRYSDGPVRSDVAVRVLGDTSSTLAAEILSAKINSLTPEDKAQENIVGVTQTVVMSNTEGEVKEYNLSKLESIKNFCGNALHTPALDLKDRFSEKAKAQDKEFNDSVSNVLAKMDKESLNVVAALAKDNEKLSGAVSTAQEKSQAGANKEQPASAKEAQKAQQKKEELVPPQQPSRWKRFANFITFGRAYKDDIAEYKTKLAEYNERHAPRQQQPKAVISQVQYTERQVLEPTTVNIQSQDNKPLTREQIVNAQTNETQRVMNAAKLAMEENQKRKNLGDIQNNGNRQQQDNGQKPQGKEPQGNVPSH